MLKASNVLIEEVIKIFTSAGVTYGLLVPTATGYKKSIMDATLSFRSFLLETGMHSYNEQLQGPTHKVVIPAKFVLPDRLIDTNASLYRPCTKQGDPRIWFSKLTRYCSPTDLLAIINYANELYVFNMSNKDIVNSFAMPGSYPYEILSKCANVISAEAEELLAKLKQIHAMGFVRGVLHGDTNVGMTLENLLKIPPNTSRLPDFKGIEIKASRRNLPSKFAVTEKTRNKKVTLFTNVPDWNRSKFKAIDILQTFGYKGDHDGLQLYCTISNTINQQGLYLDASGERDLINKAKSRIYTGDVAVWALDALQHRLSEKHSETFWVTASVKKENNIEHFRYDTVRHTRKPNVANIATFFDTGIITLDYAMHQKKSGGVRDHGYLFRTTQEKLHHIFPIEKQYSL